MSDWGEQAELQEAHSPQRIARTESNVPEPQSLAASASTRGADGTQLPSFFTSGPLSQPFASSFDEWDVAATQQEMGVTSAPQRAPAQLTFAQTSPVDLPTAASAPVAASVAASTIPSPLPESRSPAVEQPPPQQVTAPLVDEKSPTAAETSLLNKLLRQKLVQSTQSIEVQRANPDSPLYSAKTFEELPLSQEIMKGVYGMGFNRPSKIQEMALPLLLADPPQNLIAQSQSGTGKTAAFVLSMISRVDKSKQFPQALVLEPTLELAMQTGDVCKKMTKFCPDIGVTFAVRGQRAPRSVSEQIVIGTPGTVVDWLKKRCFDPSKIKVFVLDEADVMISQQGHQDQSVRIHKMLSRETQVMLFSATYEDDVMRFAERVVAKPVMIKLKRQEESLENIRQVYIECRNETEKYEALSNIYGTVSIGQAIVFCHSRRSATWLAEKMLGDGHAVAVLTGDLETSQRIAILERFRQGKEKLLVTTNVCARGIDIDQVTVVVNYDLPYDVVRQRPDVETYLHRIGRTGRFGKSGLAINFVDGSRSLRNLRTIEQHFGKQIEKIDTDDTEQVSSLGQ